MTAPSVLSRTPYQGPGSDASSWTPFTGLDCTASGLAKKAIFVCGYDQNPTLSVDGTSTSGWTLLDQNAQSGCGLAFFYKDNPTSSEKLVINASSAQQFSGILLLTDATGSQAVSFAQGATNTVADPPSVDPGASRDHLYIVGRSSNTGNTLATGAPSGYSNLTSQAGATTGNTGGNCQTAEKQATASQVEDPGTFSGGANIWVAGTLAVWMASGAVNGSGSGSVGTVTVSTPTGVGSGAGNAAAAPGTDTVSAPTGVGAGSANAAAGPGTVAVSSPTGVGSGAANAAAGTGTVTVSGPTGVGAGSASASGGPPSVNDNAPAGVGTGSATAQGGVGTVTMTAPAGIASAGGSGTGSGGPGTAAVSAPTGVSSGSASGAGSAGTVTETSPEGQGTGTAQGSGGPNVVQLFAPTGIGSGFVPAPVPPNRTTYAAAMPDTKADPVLRTTYAPRKAA